LDRGGEPDNWHNWPTIDKLDPGRAVESVLRWHHRRFRAGATLEDFARISVWFAVNPNRGGNPAGHWNAATGTSWDTHKRSRIDLDWSGIKNQLALNAESPEFRYENNVRNVGTLRWNIPKMNFVGDYQTWLITARNYRGVELFKYYYTYNQARGIEVWVWDNSQDAANKFRYIFVRDYTRGFPEGAQPVRRDGVFAGETLPSPAIIITPPAPPRIITTTLPSGTVGVSYSASLQASGGRTPYQWGLVGGISPPGLVLADNGEISGTPTSSGTFNFTVRVTDSSSPVQNATRGLSITVNPAVPPPTVFSASGLIHSSYRAGISGVTLTFTRVSGTGECLLLCKRMLTVTGINQASSMARPIV
jgi:hypothetical protein